MTHYAAYADTIPPPTFFADRMDESALLSDMAKLVEQAVGRRGGTLCHVAAQEAMNAVEVILAQLGTGLRAWREPVVVADGQTGELEVEWAMGKRRLLLTFVGDQTVEYLVATGPDILRDMQDGKLSHPADLVNVWRRFAAP